MALFCYFRLYLSILKSCFLSSVATNVKDKHRFKLEKIGPIFDGIPKNHQKSYFS